VSEPAVRHAIETEQFGPSTTVTGSCEARDCDWQRVELDSYHGRALRAAARQHVARKGHKVMVSVERLSTVEIRPRSGSETREPSQEAKRESGGSERSGE
jgi:hypothetical protein